MAEVTSKLMKIVCLHGYRQNAEFFRKKIGCLRNRLFKKRAIECYFLDGPHLIKKGEDGEEDELAWNVRNDDESWSEEGILESCNYFSDYYKENGPFDGLFGFSQGAQFAAILCSLPIYSESYYKKTIERVQGFKFVILVAGNKSEVPGHAIFYKNKIQVPSLHIIGVADTIVQKEKSEELLKCFNLDLAQSFRHAGGHYVPSDHLLRIKFNMFLDKYTSMIKRDEDDDNDDAAASTVDPK